MCKKGKGGGCNNITCTHTHGCKHSTGNTNKKINGVRTALQAQQGPNIEPSTHRRRGWGRRSRYAWWTGCGRPGVPASAARSDERRSPQPPAVATKCARPNWEKDQSREAVRTCTNKRTHDLSGCFVSRAASKITVSCTFSTQILHKEQTHDSRACT